jgi:small subunit ribosomal protein S8
MNISDPIADLLTRIRNAAAAQHRTVDIPHSRMKTDITQILKDEGYIADFSVEGEIPNKIIQIELKYTADRSPVITGLKRVSKPGLRQYVGSGDIPRVLGGMGLAIISTSRGVITGRAARKAHIGGEVLCHIW